MHTAFLQSLALIEFLQGILQGLSEFIHGDCVVSFFLDKLTDAAESFLAGLLDAESLADVS